MRRFLKLRLTLASPPEEWPSTLRGVLVCLELSAAAVLLVSAAFAGGALVRLVLEAALLGWSLEVPW